MRTPERLAYISVEEYLDRENSSPIRHEYVDGVMHAMTGTTNRHRAIVRNINKALLNHLENTRCVPDISDAKVHVSASNCFYYPDVVVSCSAQDPDSTILEKPTIIFEVLSPSTARTDRREKAVAYKTIDSLTQYVIVHYRARCLEIYKRSGHKEWQMIDLREGALHIDSLPCESFEITLDLIYQGIDFKFHVKEDSPEYDYSVDDRWADPDFELECEGEEEDDLDY